MTTQALSKERLAKMHAETMEVIDSKPYATETASIEVNAKLFATMCGALLAAHEQVPVAWTDADELRDAKQGGSGYLFEIGGDSNKFADPLRQILLHTHPAPSIPAAVPEEMTSDYAWGKLGISAEDCSAWADGWNARAAMLQSEPVKGEL
ncbi:TPA: hypothetical protein ACW7QV_003338 [Citrobacter braakii]